MSEALSEQEPGPYVCKWTADWSPDDDGIWDTACGERFVIVAETPTLNRMRFCCYCGSKLEESRYD